MKTEVYSWRLSRELKSDLERAAREHKVRVSALVDMAVREWLAKSASDVAGDEAQKKLHESVKKCIGLFASGNPRGSQTVRETVRKRLASKYGR
jgi:hypothetical protein